MPPTLEARRVGDRAATASQYRASRTLLCARLALLVVSVPAALVALNQHPGFAYEAPTLPEVVVTAPPLSVGTADTASQGEVTQQRLQEFPTLRVGETLETVPGLVVTQHSGEGKANQYFLRGFNLDHGTDIDITLDGMPVNLRTHAHGQGYADLNFMIPELVRNIDYSKGLISPTKATSIPLARSTSPTSTSCRMILLR
jgi:outer membrane cobalamin receptor